LRRSAFLLGAVALLFTTACASLPFSGQSADGPPDTDIYLADLSMIDGKIWIGTPQPLAVSNGYDNQPAFLPGGNALLYTSAGPSGKTDLWQRNLVSGKVTQLTDTPDRSEYSPRLTPDGQSVSFIQEGLTGQITEVYAQPLTTNGTQGSASAYIALKPLGYYALLDQGETVLTFLRDEPASLQRVDKATGKTQQIASNIGRALYTPNNAQTAFFTTANEDGSFLVNRYEDETGKVTALFALPGTVQDYAVFALPNGTEHGFFAAEETRLYFRTDAEGETWQQIEDFYEAGFSEISRLAVNKSATRIALVTQTQAAE